MHIHDIVVFRFHFNVSFVLFQNIEKIIVRDFFPDLPKLNAQSEYLDAKRRNDVAKLRELHIKYGSKRPTPNSKTPSICK